MGGQPLGTTEVQIPPVVILYAKNYNSAESQLASNTEFVTSTSTGYWKVCKSQLIRECYCGFAAHQ